MQCLTHALSCIDSNELINLNKMKKKIRKIRKFRKQSQLKLGESIIVLIIFFILLIVGLVFYAKIQSHITQKDGEEFNAKRAIDMALAIKFLPELQCTSQATEEFDCVDLAKLQVYKLVMDGKDWYGRYYAQMFPNAKITIKQVFAPSGDLLHQEGILLFNNIYIKDEDIKSFQKISIPITIYDSIADSNSFGFIVLEVVG
ncbi:MAG: hypothetical protein ABIG89_04400 [Candidatus Woesearchaeota archaeon]